MSTLRPRSAKAFTGIVRCSATAASHRNGEARSPLEDCALVPRPKPLDAAWPPDGTVMDGFVIVATAEPDALSRTSDCNPEISRPRI